VTKQHVSDFVYRRAGLLHFLDGREELAVLPRHFPHREREDGDLRSGKENVTNDDEFGESMLALVLAGKGSLVSGK